MKAAAIRTGRVILVLAFVMFSGAAAVAQQTMQVAANADTQSLLREAESLLANGESQRAYNLLGTREAALSGNPYYDYLLGVAALDSGRINEAVLSLRRAVAAAPQFSGARMELARALFEAGETGAARPLFVALLDEDPPPGVRDVLNRYIYAIDTQPGRIPSRFAPYAEFFAGYDSNANGSTDDQQFLGFTLSPENQETDSAFIEGAAGFDWTVPQNPRYAWQLGARASYRNNPDASFVDSGIVSAGGGLTWQSGNVFGRATLDGYWASRDGDSNESYGGIDLLLGRQLNERWDLSAGIRSGALRYDDSIEILDVNRTLFTLGASYRFASRGRFRIEAIGGSDDEQQSGSPYGNSKTGGRLSLGVPLGDTNYLYAAIGSLKSDYDGLFFGLPREDTQLTSILQIEFRDVITDGLTIAPRLRYVDNDSDFGLYNYQRLEGGLMIRWVAK